MQDWRNTQLPRSDACAHTCPASIPARQLADWCMDQWTG